MVTTKQVFIGITITSITIFICSQFINFEINNDKKENETSESDSIERNGKNIKLQRNKSKNKKEKLNSSECNKKKAKQKEDSCTEDKNEFLNKLETLFSKKNFKIVEKIINQMLEESDHENYLKWLSNQEKNIFIKSLNKDKKNQKLNNGINICIISKRDIVPGEIIYSEKPVVSILNPYLDKEEYCPTCFKRVIIPENIEEKKENFCSKECELKAMEGKRLFNNIFTSDEISEKSYVSSMSSCYGISSYDIESEVIYYENPEVETINISTIPPQNFKQQNNDTLKKNVKDQDIPSKKINNNNKSYSNSNVIFYYTDNSNNENNPILELDNNNNNTIDLNNDIEIIKVNENLDSGDDNKNDDDHYSQVNDPYLYNNMDIDRESFLQFFDTKTKSTTTSGVNEKIISYYNQLCWEKEYFYPLLILKLLILIIQDELCFKKKIKLLDLSKNHPIEFNQQQYQYSQHPKIIKSQNFKTNNPVDNNNIKYRIGNNNNNKFINQQQPQSNVNVKNKNDKPIIYTLWDHIETFPYINNYSKISSDINVETNNEFSKHDLKFFNLIHTLFYDTFYEFEDFFTDDMYQILKQKVMYNTIGITSNENFKMEKEIKDIYRIDNNKSIIGLGIYFISSYLRHNCHPNAKICFLNNNNTLSLISTKHIKKGEEITISYIDNHNKSHNECHEELYNKFKIKCFCNT